SSRRASRATCNTSSRDIAMSGSRALSRGAREPTPESRGDHRSSPEPPGNIGPGSLPRYRAAYSVRGHEPFVMTHGSPDPTPATPSDPYAALPPEAWAPAHRAAQQLILR